MATSKHWDVVIQRVLFAYTNARKYHRYSAIRLAVIVGGSHRTEERSNDIDEQYAAFEVSTGFQL